MAAAFLLAGGGAAGMSAGNPTSFRGSDTLFDFTKAIIAACPGTQANSPTLVYQGSGSDNGEKAMLGGTQQIAPMSRFLSEGACSGAANSPTTSQGLVVGLQGVSIMGSKSTFTNTACNGDSNANCDPSFESNTGAAYNTVVAGYTFAGWRDVLRVLLAGFDHDNTGTDAAAIAARDCNSAIRQALANSYGSFFENNCSATAGDASGGSCTQIRHIFRRDDFSGATDAIVSLLNLPSIIPPETMVTVFTNGVSHSIAQHTGYDPFCNSIRPAFVMPQSASQPAPTCMTGADATWAPTAKTLGTGFCNPACAAGQVCDNGRCVLTSGAGNCQPLCPAGTICTCASGTCSGTSGCTPVLASCTAQGLNCCPTENAVYRSTMQDNDPIRRTCFGAGTGAATLAEDVCEHSGDLGLVLVMNDVPEVGDVGQTSDPLRYNATPCVRSVNRQASATAPDAYDAVTQAKVIVIRSGLCPNGDVGLNTGGCLVPSDTSGNPQCLASKLTAPVLPASSLAVPAVHPVNPGIAEGRAYNLHLYKLLGNAGIYQTNGFATPLPMTGAFYRIHTNHSLNPASTTTAPITCGNPNGPSAFADMNDQIGCLVNASPCSLGYGAHSGVDHNATTTDAIKINAQNPLDLCVTGDGNPPPNGIPGFAYPLAHKLYLNSVPGFSALTGNELALAGCETNLAQTVTEADGGVFTSASGLVTTNIVLTGFLALPSFYNGGNPYCEDFNENMLCGAATNSLSCPTSVPANYTNFPTNNATTCGNGIQEQFEDCDCGTAQVPASAPPANVTACGATANGGTVCTMTCRAVQ